MKIKQFNDGPLAHYSYAIVSQGKMAIVDPARNPLPYYLYAEEQKAKIIAVFETHPHADFVSSHLQIHRETGATIYVSKYLGAEYPHESFDEGDELEMGKVVFKSLNTPGHSPDGISIVAATKEKTAVFTGDTLFIGDVGRPDLRENAGNLTAKRKELAKEMYHTMQNKYNNLPPDTIVYPAHGAGSLCGKNMSTDSSSTIKNERKNNWAFKEQSEEDFIENLLQDQPFIPGYFGFNVDLNKKGADNVLAGLSSVKLHLMVEDVQGESIIVDTRDAEDFKKGHLRHSINIMARTEKDKFETWLGAVIEPGENFLLVVESVQKIEEVLQRVAKIGYEKQLKAVITLSEKVSQASNKLDIKDFRKHKENYSIVDIRNESEVAQKKIFDNAISIPLNELRDRIDEIPGEKPVVVHCAGGYRSAAGSSILESKFENLEVFDLGEDIKKFS